MVERWSQSTLFISAHTLVVKELAVNGLFQLYSDLHSLVGDQVHAFVVRNDFYSHQLQNTMIALYFGMQDL